MKKSLLGMVIAALLVVSGLWAADKPASGDRFYGKLTKIDLAGHQLTVHNSRDNIDTTFGWNDQTGFLQNKKSITARDLQVGQSLIVAYVVDNSVNQATKVTVRPPAFKKKS